MDTVVVYSKMKEKERASLSLAKYRIREVSMQPAGLEHLPLLNIPLCSTPTIEAIIVSIHHQDGCATDIKEQVGLVVIQYDLSK